jgi:hypothetical protein
MKWWKDVTVTGNRFWSSGKPTISLQLLSGQGSYTWDNNSYRAASESAFTINDKTKNWSQWKDDTGYDQHSQFSTGQPAGVEAFVYPNRYEPGRATLVIYNWDSRATVLLEGSRLGLQNGQSYTLHNAQDYYGKTVSGTYQGTPIEIPMTGWPVAVPTGWDEPLSPSTFPRFGVFILTP